MSTIAAAAGLSKASLFHHFPTKEQLYLDIFSAMVGDLSQLVLNARLDEGEFVQRLDRLGELVVEYLGNGPDAARLLLREVIDDGPYMKGPGASAVRATMEVTTAFLQAGMAAGVFRQQDPRQLALSIAGLHLVYFATHDVSTGLLGADVFSPELLQQRRAALLGQVRALCLKRVET